LRKQVVARASAPHPSRFALVPIAIVIAIVIAVVIVVVVMIVAPVPVLLLLIAVQSAKISIFAMIFDHPLMVVDSFMIVPAVIVVVVRVVGAIGSSGTSRRYGGPEKSSGQQ
jgi:hypothetical protein